MLAVMANLTLRMVKVFGVELFHSLYVNSVPPMRRTGSVGGSDDVTIVSVVVCVLVLAPVSWIYSKADSVANAMVRITNRVSSIFVDCINIPKSQTGRG